jgi:hypothetical protein
MFESLIFTAVSVTLVLLMVLWLALGRGSFKRLAVAMIIVTLYWVATYIASHMFYIQTLAVAYVNTSTVVTLTVRIVINQTLTTTTATPATAHMSIPVTVYTTNPEAGTVINVGMWATAVMAFMLLFYAFMVLSRRLRV